MYNQSLNSLANEYTQLQELLGWLAESDNPASLLSELPQQLGQLLEFNQLRLALRYDSQPAYRLLSVSANQTVYPVQVLDIHQGPAREIFTQSRPYVFTQRRNADNEICAELAVALRTKTSTLGALLLSTSFKTATNFNLTSLLLIAAQQLAYTLQRLKLQPSAALPSSHPTLDALDEGVLTTDTLGQVNYMNPAAEVLTGWTLAEAHEQPVAGILKLINESNGEKLDASMLNAQVCPLNDNLLLIRKDNQQLPVTYKINILKDNNGKTQGKVYTLSDISILRKQMQHISYHASHDSLTGLVNRREFENRLSGLLENATNELSHSLCYIDLDRFKVINDNCGHIAGDELLKQISGLIGTIARTNDTVARLGGDEFALLLAGCPLQVAVTIAERIRSAIEKFEFVWNEKSFKLGASIGVTAFNAHSGNLDNILSKVDTACYAAKHQGRNCVVVDNENDHSFVDKEYDHIHKIRAALRNNQFCLYAQKVVPLLEKSSRSSYLEILLRLIDEDQNLLQPDEFIPIAERYNMMGEIDRWVIENTLLLNKNIQLDKHSNAIFTSINISTQSLADETILQFLQDITRQHQVDTNKYCFELSEHAVLTNLASASNFIFAMKNLGYKICIDNFGSRLSAFTYLKNLPVDYIKIDASLVQNINQCNISFNAIDAINRICHSMGIRTIAKSVRDQDGLYKLTILKVDFAQGFGVDKPQPHSEQLHAQNIIQPKVSTWK